MSQTTVYSDRMYWRFGFLYRDDQHLRSRRMLCVEGLSELWELPFLMSSQVYWIELSTKRRKESYLIEFNDGNALVRKEGRWLNVPLYVVASYYFRFLRHDLGNPERMYVRLLYQNQELA